MNPRALAVGPANAELVVGVGWRYLRDRYPHLLRQLGERKAVILLTDLERELGGKDVRDEVDGTESLAERLGIERAQT